MEELTLTKVIPLLTLVSGLLLAFATAWASYRGARTRALLKGENPTSTIKTSIPIELTDEDRRLIKELTESLNKLSSEVHDHGREIQFHSRGQQKQ